MFRLPALPYAVDALEPTVSKTTMETHWGKHHRTYVEKTNELVGEAGLADRSLESVIRAAHEAGAKQQKLFNNAAQAWNHGFFWQSMTPDHAEPSGDLAGAIADAFGDLDTLKEKFVEEGANHFASGWAWLVHQDGGLKVISTHDADTALLKAGKPLLVCDVWEHAYYLDYKQDRKAFLQSWFDQVANWSFAAEQLAAAKADEPGWRWPD